MVLSKKTSITYKELAMSTMEGKRSMGEDGAEKELITYEKADPEETHGKVNNKETKTNRTL